MGVAMAKKNFPAAMRVWLAVSTLIAAIGLATTLSGAATSNAAQAAAGSAVTITGLIMIALPCIRKWILDAADLDAVALAQIQEAEQEKAQARAAQDAMNTERERIRRDMAYETERFEKNLAAEKQRLRDQFDKERSKLTRESYEMGVLHHAMGILDAPEPCRSSVVQFPTPASREAARGVSHPS